MPGRATDLIPVVQRSYDLCAGLYEHVNRFPRAQRGLIGRVILDDALRMLSVLPAVNRRAEKSEGLSEARGRLDALRNGLRLSNRLGYLPNGGYELLTKSADEVVRMLGGWLKHERARSDAPSAPKVCALEPAPIAPAKRPRRGGVRYTMTSPTIARYLRGKLAHPEAVCFVAVGAFCQTFFEDAQLCGRVLHLALRDVSADSEPETILTCGFPRDRLETFAGRLRETGRSVHVE